MKYYKINVEGKYYYRCLSKDSCRTIDNLISAFRIVFDWANVTYSEISEAEFDRATL